MPRILVQFDGSNFYNKVKRISQGTHLTNFNYLGFAHDLTYSKENIKANYYVGEIKQHNDQPKSKDLFIGQQKLFRQLKSQGVEIKLGYLLFSNNEFHEKGVDVQIAVDIVKAAIKNEFDVFYVISSDTDLIPAIKIAREEGKEVVYVGFENFISQALSRNCNRSFLITKELIQKYSKII